MSNTVNLTPDLLGRIVHDGPLKLKIGERLGAGAYGVVYKALDMSSPSQNPTFYAVKALRAYPVGVREGVFQSRELKLHARASEHPNVVTFHRHFAYAHPDGNCILVVLDYCDGGDLFTAITEKRLFYRNDVKVKNAFLQILDAVAYIHSSSIFHRDLKPENLLCDAQGTNIRLADFGLATPSGFSNDYGLGSPFYMSPEALGASRQTFCCRQSDIWALGVILVNMISGRNPWSTSEPEDECFAAYLEDPDFLIKALPISKSVNALLKQIFNLEPLARPSIQQIRVAIQAIDTFFLSRDELAYASPGQKAIAEYYSARSPEDKPEAQEEEVDYPRQDRLSACTTASDVLLYENAPFGSPQLLAPPSHQSDSNDAASLSSSNASSSSSRPSETSSMGPTTPATAAVEPSVDVQVPDLPEGESLGEPLQIPAKDDTKSVFKKALRRLSKVIA
ncbi:Serine/threonine protein kinase [Mycena kentingensis (nom. inval.)]|nr:Serine/threonine protein kinase [Mycena kentingensis (nom. inval.)]